jgi:hypothetical protein
MHRFADHDHAFIGKDAGIAHGNFPLFVPVNTADENFSVKIRVDFGKRDSRDGRIRCHPDLHHFRVKPVKMGDRQQFPPPDELSISRWPPALSCSGRYPNRWWRSQHQIFLFIHQRDGFAILAAGAPLPVFIMCLASIQLMMLVSFSPVAVMKVSMSVRPARSRASASEPSP